MYECMIHKCYYDKGSLIWVEWAISSKKSIDKFIKKDKTFQWKGKMAWILNIYNCLKKS